MEIKGKELTVIDRDADSEFYFTHLSDDELLDIVNKMEDFEDVSNSLTELSKRNHDEIVAQQSFKILEDNLGDQYLQAEAFGLLYNRNKEKALKIINKRLSNVSVSLLKEMISNLAMDSSQPFGKSLPPEFLESIVRRYSNLSVDDKDSMFEDYELFKENFKNKLL
jgi:hypothetical protein